MTLRVKYVKGKMYGWDDQDPYDTWSRIYKIKTDNRGRKPKRWWHAFKHKK